MDPSSALLEFRLSWRFSRSAWLSSKIFELACLQELGSYEPKWLFNGKPLQVILLILPNFKGSDHNLEVKSIFEICIFHQIRQIFRNLQSNCVIPCLTGLTIQGHLKIWTEDWRTFYLSLKLVGISDRGTNIIWTSLKKRSIL